MTTRRSARWSRRQLLATASAALIPAVVPRSLRAVAASAAAAPFSRFEDVARKAGLTHTVVYGEVDSFTYIIESMACGCAFLDYDNDGWLDIFMLGGRRLKDTPPGATNRLYKNNRDGTFTDVTEKAGLAQPDKEYGTLWSVGAAWVDVNKDGLLDLFVTYYGQNHLYQKPDGTLLT
jgi:hypothetical protein